MSRLLDELRQTNEPYESGAARSAASAKATFDAQETFSADEPDLGFRVRSLNIDKSTPALTFDAPSSRVSEEYRMIRTRILQDRTRIGTVLISSPGPGDGKTTTAFNVASTLALKAASRVLLIEADLRRPSLSKLLNLALSPGLANVLNGECKLRDAVIRVEECPNLCILPAGSAKANPAELLDNARFKSLLSECSRMFSICILDGPPVASVADYDLLQNAVDSVLLVARQDHTNRVSLKTALELIPKQKMLGVVLNCVAEWFLWKDPSYAYYAGSSSK